MTLKKIDWHFDNNYDLNKAIVFFQKNNVSSSSQVQLCFNCQGIPAIANFEKYVTRTINDKVLYFYPTIANSFINIDDIEIPTCILLSVYENDACKTIYESAKQWVEQNVHEKHEYHELKNTFKL